MTNVSTIHQAMTEQVRSTQSLTIPSKEAQVSQFKGMLANQIEQTNALQHLADLETEKFMTGESENIHDVLIAMEEASLALDLTVQVRNKMVDWYQEFKNMPL